ncbi:polyribonucleotide nucleotidyltransferase [Candidatus Falkowbacteria bacterium CG10_big_fil_rev_8_21_14_0_10_39_9]|uniref:Polyribonucleotide nucleotidyltransferase n=1 Tax=Candidatus Falkowbacteria bacterium CG10_big_fil_rev_8_21_14_0_10_39_9 TaxID=1974566 RepID=A0A2M6WQR6_9BACT|nr:MAG: polyribonucleotide nucleotidyltransferase [Candidatus Falkowbacteria bacterium CG10_big_fil_rev_8_21_14_0_10_39_9]
MNNKETVVSCNWLGRTLTIKTGKLAKQADACVTVQYGDTVLMATVVENRKEREGVDFFPLMVEFDEKLYAAGIIKGSQWIKREGRPTDQAILTGRMVDRAIRPLFNEESKKDVQVIISVLSVDGVNDYDVLGLIAASAVLSIAGLKWNGPIGGVRVGLIENNFVFNPTYEQQALSSLDLIVAGTDQKVIMLEAGAKEVREDLVFDAIMAGQKEMQGAINLIKELAKQVAAPQKEETKKLITEEETKAKEEKLRLLEVGKAWMNENIKKYLFDKIYYTKGERKGAVRAIKENLDEYLFSQNIDKSTREFVVKKLAEEMIEAEVTRSILEDKRRVDGRALNEIRELSGEVSFLPRTHGTGIFSRGETQVLSVVTLGAPGLEQSLEGLEGKSKKRYMHHYNFPPYSVGEAAPMRGTGRREVGHGALAEKALTPVLPAQDAFAYTIRVVSETLGSNGSSSMASTCGSTLSLMDAGVPIKRHVGGIAMGLASNADMSKWEVLTDIQDLEDGPGGMDFKITGTDEGLTAIQLDTKTTGLSEEIIKKTLTQGREALNQVLQVLKETIPAPRAELSKYAPRIISFKIDPAKIGAVIGTGGKTINKIIDDFEVSIDIEDDGQVNICDVDSEKCLAAEKAVKDIIREFEVGEVFTGKIVRIMDFGAFLELGGGNDGLIHVSEMAPYFIGAPGDFLNVGDTVTAKIKEIDDQGRVNLTMKGLEENMPLWKDEKGKSEGRPAGSGFSRPGGNRPNGGGFGAPRRPRF